MGNYCSHEENDGYCLECHNETVQELKAEIARLRAYTNDRSRIEQAMSIVEAHGYVLEWGIVNDTAVVLNVTPRKSPLTDTARVE